MYNEDLRLIATEFVREITRICEMGLATCLKWMDYTSAWTEVRLFGMISDNRLSANHLAT